MNIKNLTLSFGTQEIFNDITLRINENEKVGIIGVNGAGKSTFFNVVLGKLEPASGKITMKPGTRVGFLPQVISDEIPDMNISVFDFLLTGRPIKDLEYQLTNLYIKVGEENDSKKYDQLMNEITKVQSKLEYWDQYQAENILLKIIAGMSIENELLDKPLNQLSGGQKSKIAFARLLYSNPEVLLLDEPTNHLDQDSKDYIVNYLHNYHGMVLVISHDIEFLDAVTNCTLYLNKATHTMELFPGNYEKYMSIKQEKEKAQLKLLEKQEKEEEKLKKIITKYIGGNEKKANIAKDRQKKLAKLEEQKVVIEKPLKTSTIKMKINRPSNLVPLKIMDLEFGYNKDKKIINDLTFDLSRGEKFLILGENGVGKSTLLKLIVGQLTPDKGIIDLTTKTDIGYYAQEHELLDLNKTIIENFSKEGLDTKAIRAHIGNFLFSGDDIYKSVKVLSPGERSKVALAKLTLTGANLLILDEPTNHLDPDTQRIIANVFNSYEGTMLIVSHNPEFVDNLGIERVLILPEGRIDYYSKEIVKHYQDLNNQVKYTKKNKMN